jgi:hypothetical protein
MKKLISVVVFLLSIGLAFAPSINANVGKEELVEFTTEVCGLNVGKQTVKLTQQQADEVEALFDSIREKLNNTESRQEAEEIFKNAVVELDKYGLLCGLSVRQAQRLVTGGYQNQKAIKVLEQLNCRFPVDDNSNFQCSIVGKTIYNTEFFGPVITLRRLIWIRVYNFLVQGYNKLDSQGYEELAKIVGTLAVISQFIPMGMIILSWFLYQIIPISFGHTIGLGVSYGTFHPYSKEYSPAEGWVHTNGKNGVKQWDEKLFGDIGFEIPHIIYTYYPGIIGFTGIKIGSGYPPQYKFLFFGFALFVNIGSEPPEFI